MRFIKKKILHLVDYFVARLLHRNITFRKLSRLVSLVDGSKLDCDISLKAKLVPPYRLYKCEVGDYSYVAGASNMSFISIGKFCSIGPNLLAGYGIHPTHGISTSPMFYSTLKQNGFTLSNSDKIDERKSIIIGNDVFVGANVTILDGVKIGDGAVLAAGAVVASDVPPYAIVGGVPAKIIKYRFDEDKIFKLLKIQWWNWPEEKLHVIEERFFDVERFINEHGNKFVSKSNVKK